MDCPQIHFVYFGVGSFLGFLLTFLWTTFRCSHPWELVDKTVLPPPIQAMAQAGVKSIYYDDAVRIGSQKLVLAMRCPKCGKARIYETY
jgi:hypothetical protein